MAVRPLNRLPPTRLALPQKKTFFIISVPRVASAPQLRDE
jgi:hypothetical protein